MQAFITGDIVLTSLFVLMLLLGTSFFVTSIILNVLELTRR